MNANGQPVALVTGTSSGMGLHTAVELARRALDVTDHDAARACVEGVLADHGRIDVLVNNAGRGAVATAEQLSLDEIRAQLEVNYLGPVALTKLVLPSMRAAGRGTVLTVTSVGGAVGQPFADAYGGAKFAVEGFMQSLAVVMLAHGVHVSVIEPAAVASDFVGNVARPEAAQAAEAADPYAAQLAAYLARSAGAFANAQSSQDAAVAIADAATSAEHRFRWQTSEGATAFVGMSLADTDGSRVLGVTRSWIE